VTGNVSYDPDNHQRMIELREEKVAGAVADVPDEVVYGDDAGELLLVSWGGTHGAVRSAVEQARRDGYSVSHLHLRWLNPMARNVGTILQRFQQVVVCELNMGQLQQVLRMRYLIDAQGLHKVKGRPFQIQELYEQIVQRTGAKA
jgi:2-oxoglutarate ferredoxin oxidoreductase subunit alpha